MSEPLSAVLSDVRTLKGIVISVLPDLMKRLELIDVHLEKNIYRSEMKSTISTQTDPAEFCSVSPVTSMPEDKPTTSLPHTNGYFVERDQPVLDIQVKQEPAYPEHSDLDIAMPAVSVFENAIEDYLDSPQLSHGAVSQVVEMEDFGLPVETFPIAPSTSGANNCRVGRNHDFTNTHSVSPSFKCTLCNQSFSKKKNLDRHKNEVHEGGEN